MKNQFRNFCKRHFDYTAADWQLLEESLFDLILEKYDLDGASEWDIVEIIDNELFEATK